MSSQEKQFYRLKAFLGYQTFHTSAPTFLSTIKGRMDQSQDPAMASVVREFLTTWRNNGGRICKRDGIIDPLVSYSHQYFEACQRHVSSSFFARCKAAFLHMHQFGMPNPNSFVETNGVWVNQQDGIDGSRFAEILVLFVEGSYINTAGTYVDLIKSRAHLASLEGGNETHLQSIKDLLHDMAGSYKGRDFQPSRDTCRLFSRAWNLFYHNIPAKLQHLGLTSEESVKRFWFWLLPFLHRILLVIV